MQLPVENAHSRDRLQRRHSCFHSYGEVLRSGWRGHVERECKRCQQNKRWILTRQHGWPVLHQSPIAVGTSSKYRVSDMERNSPSSRTDAADKRHSHMFFFYSFLLE